MKWIDKIFGNKEKPQEQTLPIPQSAMDSYYDWSNPPDFLLQVAIRTNNTLGMEKILGVKSQLMTYSHRLVKEGTNLRGGEKRALEESVLIIFLVGIECLKGEKEIEITDSLEIKHSGVEALLKNRKAFSQLAGLQEAKMDELKIRKEHGAKIDDRDIGVLQEQIEDVQRRKAGLEKFLEIMEPNYKKTLPRAR